MNHRPIETPEGTTAELRVREPLVKREDPPVEAQQATLSQDSRWLTRVVRRLTNGSAKVSNVTA